MARYCNETWKTGVRDYNVTVRCDMNTPEVVLSHMKSRPVKCLAETLH